MRKIITNLFVFIGVLEGLGRVNVTVLLAAVAVAVAIMICIDLLLDSASPR